MALTVQSVEERPGIFVVSLIGSLDSATASALEHEIEALIVDRGATVVTLDMAALEFISSMGIRVIFKAKKALARVGGTLFMEHIQSPVRQSLEVILDMIEEEEAVRRFRQAQDKGGAGESSAGSIESASELSASNHFAPIDLGELLTQAEQAWKAKPAHGTAIIDRISNPEHSELKCDPLIPVYFAGSSDGSTVQGAAVRFCEALVQFLEWLIFTGATSIRVAQGAAKAGPMVEIRAANRAQDESSLVRNQLLRSFARRFALAGFNLEIESDHFRLVSIDQGLGRIEAAEAPAKPESD